MYRNQRIDTIHAVALQFKTLWASIRWDDLQQKPPPSGANTITTETEVITTEILKRREVPPFGIRSEYLIRRIIVPIELPTAKPREKSAPIRSGLRERKRAESPIQRGPSMTESWHPEEELEIWELKQFGEKVEKAMKEQKERERIAALKAITPDLMSQRRAAEDQLRLKTSQEIIRRTYAATTNKNLTPGAGLKNRISSLINSKQQTPTQTAYAMIKTTGGQVFKVPVNALQGKQIGQQIVIKTGNTPGATTATTAATIISMHCNPPIPSTPATKTNTTNSITSPQATVTPVTQQQVINNSQQGIIIRSATNASPVVGNRIIIQPQTPLTGQKTVQIIKPVTPAVTAGGKPVVQTTLPAQQQMVQIPIKFPDGRTQMVQLPLSMLNTNQPLQIALPTPPQPQTIQLIASTSTPGGPTQLKLLTNTSPATNTTPRVIQIRQPMNTPTSGGVITTTPVLPSPQQFTPLSGMKPGSTIQLRVNAPLVQAPQQKIVLNAVSSVASTATTIGSSPVVSVAASAPSSAVTTTSSTAPLSSTLSSTEAGGEFVLTSEVSQEIIKNALLNPHLSHEMQQKLLALQKHHQETNINQVLTPTTPSKTTPIRAPRLEKPAPIPVFIPSEKKEPNPAAVARGKASAIKRRQIKEEAERKRLEREMKQMEMSPEEREVCVRDDICRQVIKGILDRIERTEKQEAKRRKTREIQVHHRWTSAQSKLNAQLNRQTELLRREMAMKRTAFERKCKEEAENELENILGRKVTPEPKQIEPQVVIAAPAVITTPLTETQQTKAAKSNSNSKTKTSSASKPSTAAVSKTEASKSPKKRRLSGPKSSSSTDASTSASKNNDSVVNPVEPPAKKKLYCICQAPYDATRFMVGCDTCHNWFHGDCIGVSEESVADIDVWVCKNCQEEEAKEDAVNGTPEVLSTPTVKQTEAKKATPSNLSTEKASTSFASASNPVVGQHKEKDGEELFCLCRRPYDESQFYICCDSCQDWFHGRCVGVLQKEADTIDVYVCPNCQRDSGINHANLKALNVVDTVNLRVLLNQIKAHKSSWPFLEPVNARDVPDYYKVIKEPMGELFNDLLFE